MDYWQTFKIKTVDVQSVIQELKKLEKTLPYGFGKKFGNYNIYLHKKKRVSEIHIGVSCPAMMVSLNQSMQEFNEIRQSLAQIAIQIGAKAEEIMLTHKAWKVD